MSTATSNIDNDQKDEDQKEPRESAIKKEQNQKPDEKNLIIHYMRNFNLTPIFQRDCKITL
jgi:hypothetical protein